MTKSEQARIADSIRKVADLSTDPDRAIRAIVQAIATEFDFDLPFVHAATGVIDLSGRNYLRDLERRAAA